MKRLAILILMMTLLPAWSGDAPSGKDLYLDNCVDCHGDDAEGDDQASPDIRGATRTQLDRALPGFDQMPEFEFTEAEIVAVQGYLEALE